MCVYVDVVEKGGVQGSILVLPVRLDVCSGAHSGGVDSGAQTGQVPDRSAATADEESRSIRWLALEPVPNQEKTRGT